MDDEVVKHGCDVLKYRVLGLHNAEVFDRIATALGELKHLYQGEGPDQTAIEEAIATGGLVILKASGKVYWEKQPIRERLVGPQWKMLDALARKAQPWGRR